MKKQPAVLIPHRDDQSRTCLVVNRAEGVVSFIPMSIEGFAVETLPAREFDTRYKPLTNYPAERAARLYLAYAKELGATTEALDHLGSVITITKQEYDMATAKKASRASGESTTKTKPAKAEKTAKPAPVKAASAPKPAKAEKPTKATKPAKDVAPRETASALFQQLLMEGKDGVCLHTDDQIFKTVQAKFGLDDSKRSYVKWYRNNLIKKGEKVPAAKS